MRDRRERDRRGRDWGREGQEGEGQKGEGWGGSRNGHWEIKRSSFVTIMAVYAMGE